MFKDFSECPFKCTDVQNNKDLICPFLESLDTANQIRHADWACIVRVNPKIYFLGRHDVIEAAMRRYCTHATQ